MRKFLLSILFFVFACANAWGASPWTSGGTTVTLSGSSTNKTLTITKNGNGAMATTYTSGTAPWYSERANIKHIVISSGVTSVGPYAFEGISSSDADINVPVSCTSFGSNAFANCSTIVKIFYAGSPDQWADITFSNAAAHPFGDATGSRQYYFNGNTSSYTSNLVFSSSLTEIKPYTFQRCSIPNGLSIPGTVESIGRQAFYGISCSGDVAINRKDAPSIGDYAFEGISKGKTIYVPTGATGYPTTSASTTEIKYDWYFTLSQKAVSGTVDGVAWTLNSNGVFTLTGPGDDGAISTSFVRPEYTGTKYPYYNFRYLVEKVVVSGSVTALSNFLQRCEAVQEVDIDQAKIPTASSSLPTLIHGGTIALVVNPTALADASASNLGTTPWTDDKFGNVTLSDNLVIGDNNANNSTVLANCSTYVEAPITLQLGRSLTNTQYNTFCSPIALTKDQLNDADIRALTGTSLNGDELTLTFSASSLEDIEAGKPYLVQPTTEALSNPTFTNIDPSSLVSTTENAETEFVDFIGVLAPTGLTGGNKNTLFLGADNELFWPEADGDIKGMRAYFSLKDEAQQAAKRARIVMNPEVATDIESISDERLTISGKKILRNGQLFIIRDNKTYNAQGQLVK